MKMPISPATHTPNQISNNRSVPLLLATAVLLACSFATPLAADENEDLVSKRPPISILYFPYSVSLNRDIWQPHPNYTAWTDRRMKSDLKRLTGIGIDQVIVNLDVERILTQKSDERYHAFLTYAEHMKNGPEICFQAELSAVDPKRLEAFFGKLARMNLHRYRIFSKVRGKPILMVRDHSPVQRHRLFHLELIELSRMTRHNRIKDVQFAYLNDSASVVMVFAGLYEKNAMAVRRWRLSRKDGKTLDRNLQAAIHYFPNRVIISSWNNFTDGSFIEPSRKYSDRAYRSLVKSLKP